jgi:hypothetical protein
LSQSKALTLLSSPRMANQIKGFAMKALCYILLSSILISGCSNDDVQTKNDANAVVSTSALSTEQITYDLFPSSDVNKYRLNIKWPNSSGKIQLRQGNDIIFVSSKIFSYDVYLDGGQSYDFAIEQLASENSSDNKFNFKVNVPKDLMITGNTELLENTKIKVGRLFLIGRPTIQTNQFNLEISAEEIISEDAKIITFRDGAVAPQSQPGMSAGNISIISKRASGKLEAIISGQQAGPGRHSFCHPGGYCNAEAGKQGGNIGNFYLQLDQSSNFQFVHQIKQGAGGVGGTACFNQQVPGIIMPDNNNCGGFGTGANGGAAGTVALGGTLCWKLSKEALSECAH